MVLPLWNPDRLAQKIPFNIALTGGRKQGKSVSVAHLVDFMKGDFDLVICMVGSAACNPVLQHLLQTHWDPRFFFSVWDPTLIENRKSSWQPAFGARSSLFSTMSFWAATRMNNWRTWPCGVDTSVSVWSCAR